MSEAERSEQETMDRLLRSSLGRSSPPGLPADFDRRLSRRLAPRRLDGTGRLVLALYSAAALAASVWLMRSESIGWPLVIAALVLPLLVVAPVWRRALRPRLVI